MARLVRATHGRRPLEVFVDAVYPLMIIAERMRSWVPRIPRLRRSSGDDGLGWARRREPCNKSSDVMIYAAYAGLISIRDDLRRWI